MAGRAEFWSGHIAAQLASGSTQRAYCERHGIAIPHSEETKNNNGARS